VACGGSTSVSPPASATVTGTVDGQPVAAVDVISFVGPQPISPNASLALAVVSIGSTAGFCHTFQTHDEVPSSANLSFVVSASGTTVPPGTYPMRASPSFPGPGTGDGSYTTTDAHCGTATVHGISEGSVTLTEVSSTTVQGTFDFTMDSGDHLTGAFVAPVCESWASVGAGDGGLPVCK
jgi:hypothetical protein